MIRKVLAAAALATVVAGAAFADTPIGPGVTGSGGTGINDADLQLRQGAGPEAHLLLRQDGMPAERADQSILASAGTAPPMYAVAPHSERQTAVGMSASSAATGAVGGSVALRRALPESVWLPGHMLD